MSKKHLLKRLRKTIFEHEDARILQKKITGQSVYKRVTNAYRRTPKHRNLRYSHDEA